jgi:hypothetical protein
MTPNEMRLCLERRGWSQRGLARLLELDDRLVRRWASGQNEIPENIAHWLATLAAFHAKHPPPAIAAPLALIPRGSSPKVALDPYDAEEVLAIIPDELDA